MGRAVKKNLDRPDEHLMLGWLTADVVQLGDASIARTAMSPGARCSLNNNGGGSCQANHAGFVLSGRMGVETDDGLQLEFGPNDVFDVGPGHERLGGRRRLEIRQGIHTGEVELAGAEIRGVGVHEAARVSAAAGAGQVLVSATTRALASGSGAAFESRGERQLKGLDGPRELFEAVESNLTAATA